MAYERQISTDVKFVDYGKLKEGHDKAYTIVIEEGKSLEGLIMDIREHDTYKYTYRMKVKNEDMDILLLGNSSLNRQMKGIGLNDEQMKVFSPVEVGNKVKITFNGMYPTDAGNKGYDITIEVDR